MEEEAGSALCCIYFDFQSVVVTVRQNIKSLSMAGLDSAYSDVHTGLSDHPKEWIRHFSFSYKAHHPVL